MKSRLKLYGPGIVKALALLDELSMDLEKISHGSHEAFTEEVKDKKEVRKLLRQGSTKIGTYDYHFTWIDTPSMDDIKELIRRIDEKLIGTSVRYTITTTELPGELTEFDMRENSAISVLKFVGPSIYKAIEKIEGKLDEIPEIFASRPEILGKGTTKIGEFDFSFSWGMYPTVDMIKQVIVELDDLLDDTGVNYTITTFGKMKKADKESEDAYRQAIRKKAHKLILQDARK
ncbi:MAG: hypothetical protein ACFFD4_03020 [Candidatus Odinarchaeota archaeon]